MTWVRFLPTGKRTAITAAAREANYQNVEESKIWVCAWLLDLPKECRCPVAISDVKQCLAKKIVGIRHCAAAFFLHVLKLCKDLNLILLYISVLGTYSKCVRENVILMLAGRLPPAAVSERWPQVCRVKITFELLPTNWFVSTKTNSMKCFVNWIPLNTHVRSHQT